MKFLALVIKELRVLAKDKHGLAVLFVMPAVFILIMSLAMRDAFDRSSGVTLDFLLLNQSETAQALEFEGALGGLDGFVLRRTDQPPEAIRSQLADDRVKFALVIPAGFPERLKAWGENKDAESPVQLLISPAVAPASRFLFEMALERELHELYLNSHVLPTLRALSFGFGSAVAAPPAPGGRLDGEYVYKDGVPRLTPTAVQQSVPAWLVFSMFFVVIPLSTAFLVERQQGTLVRLQMMNVSPAGLLGAKVVPYYLINQVQMLLMLAVGMYLVPRLGGDALNAPGSWAGLLAISSAASVGAIGWALLISTLVRSGVGASTLGGLSNIVFGALGGVMVPKFVMPPFMQEILVVSPMSWGLEGFLDVFLRGGGWLDVLPEAAALTAFGALSLTLAALTFTRHARS